MAFVDAVKVTAVTALGVVADEDGLPHWDHARDPVGVFSCRVGFLFAFVGPFG
jgi:hypothetical protein